MLVWLFLSIMWAQLHIHVYHPMLVWLFLLIKAVPVDSWLDHWLPSWMYLLLTSCTEVTLEAENIMKVSRSNVSGIWGVLVTAWSLFHSNIYIVIIKLYFLTDNKSFVCNLFIIMYAIIISNMSNYMWYKRVVEKWGWHQTSNTWITKTHGRVNSLRPSDAYMRR